MTAERLDLRQVRRVFARAAADYEHHDALPREVESRLFDSLDYYQGKPARVLDLGCGTGRGTARLKKRWRTAEVIALDLSLPMLREARRHAGWWKPMARVCADGRALPFPDHCIDVVYSNLCLPWCEAPRPLLREIARVLRPGGLVVASSLGPDTLAELRAAWAAADTSQAHVARFPDLHEVGDAALAAGLKDPVLDADHVVMHYPDTRALFATLRGMGAGNVDRARPRTLTGKARFQAMHDAYETENREAGGVRATWEIVTLHAWGPPEGFLPRYGGRETPFEVISRREPRPRG